MGDNNEHKVYIAGKGMFFEYGFATAEELREFKKMSKEAQTVFINKRLSTLPDANKKWLGYCRHSKKHVELKECMQCARDRGFKKLAQWEGCKTQNIGK